MNRRTALRLLVGTGGVLAIAACGPAGSTPAPAATVAPTAAGAPKPTTAAAPAAQPTTAPQAAAAAPTAAAQAAAAGQPRSGGTLRTAIGADPASLDGHLFANGRFDTTWLIYDRLTEYDLNATPQPRLAESWEISPDYRTIKLNLRKGVTYHDGREFTSDDVKWNFLRVRDPSVGAGAYVAQSNWFTDFETPDKTTLILKSDEPRPLVFDFFERLNMLDKNVMEGPDAKTKANGTGPFKFVEWVQGDHFASVKNPNFWVSGQPYLDGVRTVIIKDQQAAVAQLEAGQIDVMQMMNLVDFRRLKGDPRFKSITNDVSTGFYAFGLNTTWAPLDNKLVRQAMNWAVNRKRWVDGYFGDTTTPVALEWVPGTPAYDAQKVNAYTFDLDKARALLKEAGVGSFTMDMVLIPSPESTSLVQIYQADLAQLGITLNILNMDLAPWLDLVNNRRYKGMYYSPAGLSASVGTELTTSKLWQIGNNNSGFDSPLYQELGKAANTETDPAKLKQVYDQVNDLMLDESFVIPLTPRPPTNVTRAAVHTNNQQLGGWWYRDAWLDA